MKVYWIIVGAVIVFGLILPQQGKQRKLYISLMAVLHAFISGFRYMYLTGDLRKYAWDYSTMVNYNWFSDEVFHGGRNVGFYWLMKFFSQLTNGDFQLFLLFLSIVMEIIVAVLIYRYSPKPWLSYLVWNCMGFYVAGFSLIKQYLAMAIIMYAIMFIFEKKPIQFYLFVGIAGLIHMPALVFLPAYFLANRRIDAKTVWGYIVAATVIYIGRNVIVQYATYFYYEEETFQLVTNNLGGRFLVIVLILVCGFLLREFREKNYERLFNIITVAAILQMFAGYDNVFTRLSDYYLQFAILFIPMIFYEATQKVELNTGVIRALLPFNKRSMKLLVVILTVALIWWYWTTCIGVTIADPVDDYTKFRFMWNV